MRLLDLFAGIGGFSIGTERAGMETIGFVENDKHCQAVLERHWPGVPIWGDIHGYEPPAGVDVLTGGFPCTDYSVAGKRAGLAGDRGALWWQLHRIAAECRPTWIVGENVPGLLSSNNGDDFRTIVDSLVQLGYGVTWAVLDSQYFGVAQQRRRVFIVGHSGGTPRPEILALSEGLFGYPAPRRETRKGVAAVIEGRPDFSSRTAASLGTNTEGFRTTDPDNNGAWAVSLDPHPALMSRSHKSPNVEGNEDAVVNAGAGVRRLTPVECARLQSFPDDFNDHLSDTQRYRQYGNAVTTNVAEWIGHRIMGSQ